MSRRGLPRIQTGNAWLRPPLNRGLDGLDRRLDELFRLAAKGKRRLDLCGDFALKGAERRGKVCRGTVINKG